MLNNVVAFNYDSSTYQVLPRLNAAGNCDTLNIIISLLREGDYPGLRTTRRIHISSLTLGGPS